MVDIVSYGSTDPIPFKITLNGVGVNVTLASDDVKLSKDGAAFANATAGGGTVTAIDASLGWYKFTPVAADTQVEYGVINVKDASAGGAFDETAVVFYTCGNASSRYG